MTGAYYNEIDKQKAAWLRELIKRNVIAPGDVDERSIKNVEPADLVGYTQCHWFAGIGVWSYALRLAGWPDDREVWTGSCPCPSFSCAGKGGGFDDPRHLWPEWFRLIRKRRPGTLFSEQSDDAIGFGWLDLVATDLEAEDYAIAPAVLGSHSVGGADLRQRLYFVAHTSTARHERRRAGQESGRENETQRRSSIFEPERLCDAGELGHSNSTGLQDRRPHDDGRVGECAERESPSKAIGTKIAQSVSSAGIVADADVSGARLGPDSRTGKTTRRLRNGHSDCGGAEQLGLTPGERCEGVEDRQGDVHGSSRAPAERTGSEPAGPVGAGELEHARMFRREWGQEAARGHDDDRPPSPLNGFWQDADWLLCRDGKWRPTESIDVEMDDGLANDLGYMRIGNRYSLNPLITKGRNRVLRLRGYGDAINSRVAKTFIEAYLDTERIGVSHDEE